jgi:hypothetical protein
MHGDAVARPPGPNTFAEGGLQQLATQGFAAAAHMEARRHADSSSSSRSIDNLHSPPEPATVSDAASYASPAFVSVRTSCCCCSLCRAVQLAPVLHVPRCRWSPADVPSRARLLVAAATTAAHAGWCCSRHH